MDKIKDFILLWVSNKSGIEIKLVKENINIFEEGYVDSLGAFELISELENKFLISFSENDFQDRRLVFASVNSLSEVVKDKVDAL
ncbi:MAG: acyl carrier protein [Arcobacter sp.]|uniref:acyl carrier protein n=1 Tax=Arcobacter sp. TaxID=1872629 RepID=UPI003AFF962B